MKYNVALDSDNFLRVKSKIFNVSNINKAPPLMSSNYNKTKALIWDFHMKTRHGQVFKSCHLIGKAYFVPK